MEERPLRRRRIASRATRIGTLLAIGLFLAAAALAQSQPPAQRPADAAQSRANVNARPALYGPPASGNSAAILFVPATVNLIAGLNGQGYGGDGGLATSSSVMFNYPVGMAYDSDGNLYIADQSNYIVRRIDHATGVISTYAGEPQTNGTGSITGGTATSVALGSVSGLAIDSSNNVYVADRSNEVVWKITPGSTPTVAVYAGGGASPGSCTGFTDSIGDGCAATDASLDNPWALSVDSSNNLYISDSYNNLIRKVDATTGKISIFAGNIADINYQCSSSAWTTSAPPYTATQMNLCYPNGVAFDSKGNAYIDDSVNDVIRVIDSSGNASILGGTFQMRGFGGDGGPVSAAYFNEPAGLYVDPSDHLYISDFFNARIRVVDSAGNINTVFGDGFGDLKYAGQTIIGQPDTEVFTDNLGAADGIYSVVMDPNGNLVVSQSGGEAVTSAGSTGQYIFPDQQIYSTSNAIYVTVSNPSGVTLTFSGTPVVTGPFAIVAGTGAGTCTFPGSVDSAGSCTIGITFTPTADQAYTGSIVLDSNSNTSPNTISLSGTGIGYVTPSATITSPPSAFNSEAGVTSASQPVVVTNTGVSPITLQSTQFIGLDPTSFSLESSSCTLPAVIQAKGTCTFNITFTPIAATTYSAGFQVYISTQNYGYLTASLSGTGTAAPSTVLGFSASSMNFYGQIVGTTSGTIVEQITNPASSGNTNVMFTSITATPPFAVQTGGANACTTTTALQPDNFCNVYVTFTPTAAQSYTSTLTLTDNASGSPQTVPLSGQGVIFSSPENVQQATQTMNVYFTAYGETVNIDVLTQGQTGQDFYADSTTGSCQRGTDYSIGQSCTVNVDFSPEAPGPRNGSVVITDASGNVLAALDLPGTGIGPLLTFEPGTQSTVAAPATEGGYQGPLSVAVDTIGDVFVSDSANNRVVYLPGDSNPQILPAASPALNAPFGVAVDGLGDVFVADVNNARVVEWPWNAVTKTYATPTYIEGSFSQPAGVALDGYGNLYVADEGHNEVFEVPVQPGGTYGTAAALAFTGLHFPKGVAVDGNLNVFVADTGDGNIDELPWKGTGYAAPTTVISGLDQPIALAVDASGSLYTADAYGATVFEYPFNGTSYGSATTVGFTGLQSATGIALDPYGDVYVVDATKNDVQQLLIDETPVLSFATTAIGKTSTDSPQNVTATNIGNQALSIAAPGTTNPSYPPDFPENTKASSLCAGNTNVNPGASCVVSVNFTPLNPGNLSEDVNITDNNFGQEGNDDDISVNGTATGVATAVTLSPSSLDFGGVQIFTTSFPLAVQVTANSGSVSLAGSAISQTGDIVFALTTGANACTTSTMLTVGQSCSFYVTYSPLLNEQPSTGTLTIGSTGQTVALSGIGLYFNTNVGNSLPGQDVSVLITTAGTPAAISVLTNGVTGLDYTNAGGGTCATGTAYTVGTVCTVDVAFAPLYSGARDGAVMLTDSSGHMLGITYLTGYGAGAQIAYYPVTAIQGGYSTSITAGIAVDAKDDVFYIDASDNLQELAPTATKPTLVVSLSTLLNSSTPSNMAIDAAGNIFVAGVGTILEVPSTGSGTWGTPLALSAASALGNVENVAVDALGNLYAIVPSSSAAYKIPFSDGAYGTPVALGFPTGYVYDAVAVDSGGDVFLLVQNGSTGACQVLELPANNTGYGSSKTLLTTVGSISGGSAIAVDDNGNLFVSGLTVSTSGAVYLISGTGTPVELDTGILGSLAIDSSDNVFSIQSNRGDEAEITEVPMATSPTLAFMTTAVGATSSDSPKTATVINIGNGNLYFDGVQYPTDYPENSGDTNLCNLEYPVAPGASCDVSADFTPTTSGTLDEDATLTDNNLNGDGAQQLIPFIGIGTQSGTVTATLTPTTLPFGSVVVGSSSQPQTLTLANTSNSASLTITSISITESNGVPTVLRLKGAALKGRPAQIGVSNATDYSATTTCDSTLAAGATCTISVTFTPSTTGSLPGTVSVVDSASGSPQTASLTGTGTQAAAPTATLTPSTVPFGSVDVGSSSTPQTLTLTNTSTAASLSISSITLTESSQEEDAIRVNRGAGTGRLAGPRAKPAQITIGASTDYSATTTCGSTLAAGASCTISVTFTPESAGSLPGTVTVSDNATGSPQMASLTGTGVAVAPAVSLAPATLAFGSQAVNSTSAAQTVTVTNSGNGPLTIDSIYLNEPNEDDGVVRPTSRGGRPAVTGITINPSPDYAATTNCGTTLAAGASCTISVTFDPSTTGSLPGTLAVSDNASNSPQLVNLTGTGYTQGGYTVASPTPPQTVKPGAAAQYTINVAVNPAGDIYSNQVSLSASGLPAGATATFSPVQVVPGTGTAASMMTVQTSSQLSALDSVHGGSRWPILPSTLALAFGGAWAVFRRRHRERLARYLSMALLLGFLGAATFGLMGCGAGFAQFQPKTYTITVTGTSGEETQTTTVQLTVE